MTSASNAASSAAFLCLQDSAKHMSWGLHLERARERLHGVDGGFAELVPPHKLTPHVVVLGRARRSPPRLPRWPRTCRTRCVCANELVVLFPSSSSGISPSKAPSSGAHALEVFRSGDHRSVVRLEEREVVHVQRVTDGAHLRGFVQGVDPLDVGVFVLHLRERRLGEGRVGSVRQEARARRWRRTRRRASPPRPLWRGTFCEPSR